MTGPNPNNKHPLAGFPQVGFLKNFITSENIDVGDFTYYDDPEGPENFEKNVLYHFDFIGDKLIIGKYCAIATGVKFIMNGANHKMSGFSTYPFQIFGNGWEKVMPKGGELPFKGDTEIGNDVWIGYESTIMPGVKIGNGAIIASKSVVTQDVPPYSIIGGNPAKVIKMRFEQDVIEMLQDIAWWNWPVEKVTEHLEAIVGNDLETLKRAK
ncbi:Vat family streptogramin A O-acetyltransferase [Pseudoalteromonas luteoviolacea]|uniref:Vat n=1 Tax=Pseudoalteromonas luteoviolacea S4054 TaxID=1129367 RepID=A0A0F6AIN9_9GAMM|nr:Vat family streptogramin A O-acetyltransferase [Pseudoalteromonas luteoviolacea]AOT07870.1 chloramphenicol acetyltransferase [Pseudoalteromonas luteoviolacea]AOT12786.1 chloramphenicol acetyltransferase [Pseudoalteromonas luteoviolacea]AOT17699.1 chloramphenicol acetyltransferase [Pseudoalteromonas luteoviolacea]KKE85891.1 Vat [Pseudoalteromonas luteoviolacea S4054]KZN74769.1 Vat [Pseudoalteromonas luteoviolacea S4047-1]